MRKPALAACRPLLVLVLAAGCTKSNDGRGVASANGSAGAHPSSTLSPLEQARRHAQCMREHQVPEADPVLQPNGDVQFGGGYNKRDLDPTVLSQALEACRPYLPVLSAAQVDRQRQAAAQYAQCMRAHEVENFPDPDANGHFDLSAVGMDPDYKVAGPACQAQASQAPSPTGSR
jgi:hypothetical protein